jgi:hypothetical protein
MVPYITHYDLMEIGALVDIAQLFVLLAVTYVLWCLVRMMRQVSAIGRFWLRQWWAVSYGEEAAGDRKVPNAPPVPLPSTPATREWAERISGWSIRS